MEEVAKIQMRKRNMKIFPIYKRISWDYIFFYTINFLFLTQVKNINPADVVLIDSFYSIFAIFAQIPATFIIEFLGRKNSIILANVISCLYMMVIIFSKNLFNLAIAEILSATAFAIKESAEPGLLNESIPPTNQKSKIYAKIVEKGMSNYYIINAISIVIAGFLYEINPYIPITLSLTTVVIATIIATFFIETIQSKNKRNIKNIGQMKEIEEAFKFVLKSERVKALILFSAIATGLLDILVTYEVSLLEELNMPASYLGIIFAILGIVASFATRSQERFHNKFRNKSLIIIGFSAILACICGGSIGIIAERYKIGIIFIIIFYIIRHLCLGMYHPLIEKYLTNFTNKQIDTKIFTANNLLKSITSAITGIFASFLLNRMETAYCMITVGIIFFIIMIFVAKFMKSRVGLEPEEYPREEVKYDKLIKG